MTYNTGNPIGSTDARDRLDNSENMDILENSTTLNYHADRLGTMRKTRKGMELEHDNQITAHEAEHDAQISAHEAEHDAQMLSFENDFDGRLAGMAFTRVGTFTTGATLTDMRQTLLWEVSQGGDGHEYGWAGAFSPSGKVVAAGSSPTPVSAGNWVDRTEGTLRGDLTNSVMSLINGRFALRDFLSVWDFNTDTNTDTEMMQSALTYAQSLAYPVSLVITKSIQLTSDVTCIKDDLSIVGFGGAKIIFDGGIIKFGNHSVDSNGYFTTTAPQNKNLTISGLTCTSSTQNTNSVFISIVGYDNTTVTESRFDNFKIEGLYFGCGNRNIKVDSTCFDATGSTAESKGLTILHFSPDYANGIPISLTTFLQVESTPSTFSSDITITCCNFVKTRCQLSNIRRASISGNNFKDITSRGINCSPHIYDVVIDGNIFELSATASTGVNLAHLAKNVTISNNIFTGSDSGSARCINVYYQASAYIKGNRFNSATTNTITCNTASKVEISGNTFQSKNLEGNDVYITSKDFYASDATVGSLVSDATVNTFAVIKDNVFLAPKARPIYIKGEMATSNSNPIPISGTYIGKNVFYDYSKSRVSYGDAVVRVDSIGGAVSDISLMIQKLSRTSTSVAEISPAWGYYSSTSSGGSISFRDVEENSAEFLVTFSAGKVTATRISGPQEITLTPSFPSNLVGLVGLEARCATGIASVSLDFTRTNSLGAGSASIFAYPSTTPFFKVFDYAGAQIALSTANGSMYCKVRYNSLG